MQRTLADQRTFELGHGSEHLEHELASRGSSVDGLGQRPDARAAPLQLLENLEQMAQRSRNTVELPDDEHITGLERLERGLKLGTVLDRGELLLVDLADTVTLERVELKARFLVNG